MTDLQKIAWIARAGLALIFIYHGLVPKLLWLSPGELQMIQAHGIEQVALVARLSGVAEIVLGLWLLLDRRRSLALWISAFALLALLVDVAVMTPGLLLQAFNPVSVNGAGLALCAIAWIAQRRG